MPETSGRRTLYDSGSRLTASAPPPQLGTPPNVTLDPLESTHDQLGVRIHLDLCTGQGPRRSLHLRTVVACDRQDQQGASRSDERGDVLRRDPVLSRRHRLHRQTLDNQIERTLPSARKVEDIGDDVRHFGVRVLPARRSDRGR